MNGMLQKGERDDSATVKIKSAMELKNSDRQIKTPKSKRPIFQSNRGISRSTQEMQETDN